MSPLAKALAAYGVAAVLIFGAGASAAQNASNKSVTVNVRTIEKGIEKGIDALKRVQNPDGSYGKFATVGQTAMTVTAMADSHLKLRAKDGPYMRKAVDYCLKHRQDDGGIYSPEQPLNNYNTSIAIIMLVALEDPKYKETIRAAKDYVVGIQRRTDPKTDPMDGGIGYTKDENAPDMSNTLFAVEALEAAKKVGIDTDPEVYRRLLTFIKRCQNDGEVNDQEWAALATDPKDAGGFIYQPGGDRASRAGQFKVRGRVGWRSYGSMTYGAFKSYIHASGRKDDPSTQGALKWISNNYTLDENPGMGKAGYYYYLVVFAKGLAAYGERTITDSEGVKHDWAKECAAKILSMQNKDGAWVNAESTRWYEKDPALTTAYALQALNVCREQLRARAD